MNFFEKFLKKLKFNNLVFIVMAIGISLIINFLVEDKNLKI